MDPVRLQAQVQPDRLLRVREVAQRLGVSRVSVWRWVAAKQFPPPLRIGRISAWSERELSAWLEARLAARAGVSVDTSPHARPPRPRIP